MSPWRLTPVVAAVWAGAALGITHRWAGAVALGCLLCLAAIRWPRTAVAAGLAGTIALGVGWARQSAVDRGVLSVAAQAGDSGQVVARFDSVPRAGDGAFGPNWTAAGRVRGVAVAGVWRSAGGRVMLTGLGEPPIAGPGDFVGGRARLARGDRPGLVAWVRFGRQVGVVPGTDWLTRTRRVVTRSALRLGPADRPDVGALLAGMTIGSDEALSGTARGDMREAGLSHLTAVSGSNCALVLAVPVWLLSLLGCPRRPRLVIGVGLLAGYAVVVGADPSVLRAAVMAGLGVAGSLLGGSRIGGHTVQVAVLLLLLADPWLALSMGLALSVAATVGLVLAVDSPRWWSAAVWATVAAQMATLPLVVAMGGQVGPATVLANVVVSPAVAVITLTGLLGIAVDVLGGPAAWFAVPAVLGARWVLMTAHAAAHSALADVVWPAGVLASGAAAVLIGLAVVVLGVRVLLPAAVLVLLVVPLAVHWLDGWPPPGWYLVACDVGQGDSFVLRSGTTTVVVDTGPDPDLADRCLRRLGVRTIDLLVLTHFHSDHVDGLPGVVAGRTVRAAWVSPLADPAEEARRVASVLAERGVPASVPEIGTVVVAPDLRITVLWPRGPVLIGSPPNNSSVCFLAETPHGRVLFLGDIEAEAQRSLEATWPDLAADVVKVPHHGSANLEGSLPGRILPDTALIGVGEGNTYGHPAPEALRAWQSSGAEVLTTEANGDVALVADGSAVARSR